MSGFKAEPILCPECGEQQLLGEVLVERKAEIALQEFTEEGGYTYFISEEDDEEVIEDEAFERVYCYDCGHEMTWHEVFDLLLHFDSDSTRSPNSETEEHNDG